jgi:hypothetical protein
MTVVKLMLSHALSPDTTTLKGRAIECIGLLGEAVGVECFAGDALEVMNFLIRAIVRFSNPIQLFLAIQVMKTFCFCF